MLALAVAGCATPQYAIHPSPVPDESDSALAIERELSELQGRTFEQQGSRPIGWEESVRGFPVQQIVNRLSGVTERSTLAYRAHLYQSQDPNAAALADGRVYLSTGMLDYLAGRDRAQDQLAFVIGHELAHTVAQHLVKRYRTLQQQQLLMELVGVGAAAVTRNASVGVQQAGQLALDAASLLQDVANSGYSQTQELEADQLGIRYVIRAGFTPEAALALLQDFSRFEQSSPFLRTHPYATQRRADLQRYLADIGALGPSTLAEGTPSAIEAKRRRLRDVQHLYPAHSVSWENLQRQLDALGP